MNYGACVPGAYTADKISSSNSPPPALSATPTICDSGGDACILVRLHNVAGVVYSEMQTKFVYSTNFVLKFIYSPRVVVVVVVVVVSSPSSLRLMPRRKMLRLATPRPAMPCHAVSRHATSCRAVVVVVVVPVVVMHIARLSRLRSLCFSPSSLRLMPCQCARMRAVDLVACTRMHAAVCWHGGGCAQRCSA